MINFIKRSASLRRAVAPQFRLLRTSTAGDITSTAPNPISYEQVEQLEKEHRLDAENPVDPKPVRVPPPPPIPNHGDGGVPGEEDKKKGPNVFLILAALGAFGAGVWYYYNKEETAEGKKTERKTA